MITLDRIRYFAVLAKYQHIGQASKALGLSPSALSSAIRSLEEELGDELFLREKKRLKLNERGSAFLVNAVKLLEDADRLKSEFLTASTELKGHHRLGGSHYLVEKLLAPACLLLRKKNPKVTFELVSVDTSLAAAQVKSGSLDGALVFRSDYTEAFEEKILLADEFRIAVRSGHPILREDKRTVVQKLNQLPAMTFRPSLGVGLWERHPALGSTGIVPKHACFYDDSRTAIQLITRTDGWGFLPSSIISSEKSLRSLSTIKLSLPAPVNISFITASGRGPSQFMKAAESEIMKLLKQ